MNIKELQSVFQAADQANDSVIVESVHGVGKSDAVKQFAREHNYYCRELFLSMMDTGDLIGIPRQKQIGTSTITVWAEPDWFQQIVDEAFPQINRMSDLVISDNQFAEYLRSVHHHEEISRTQLNDIYSNHYDLTNDRLHVIAKDSTVYSSKGRRSVLFLDELNRSNLDVRQAALQLILNKELHSHKLPYINGKCTLIVAAINPADIYQVDELDDALLDRFLHVTLEPDAKEWLSWARSANINQIVQDFIAEKPKMLHYMPTDKSIGATPRSWAKLAAFVDHFDKTPKEVQYTIIKGKIGEELAGQFLQFYNNYSKVVKVEDIEALVTKEMKRTTNPEVIAKKVAKLIENQEAIQKNQLAEVLYDKYVINGSGTSADAMPMLAFLYALEIENLAAFLKPRKDADHTNYVKLVKIDDDLNSKALFKKITTKLVSK